MKRLTTWYDGNQAICENEECSLSDCPFADPICEQVQSIIDRLAAYEDTGLEPEEISKIREDVENGYLKSTARRYGVSVDRLRELAEADREGRCVVLPRLEPVLPRLEPGQGDPPGELGPPGPPGIAG